MASYRPFSLLSVFNKILEKLMHNRLFDFFEKNKVFFEGQFGFRSNHSTIHAIYLISDKIHSAIENKLFSCGIFLDLTKAFDTVDHDILIRKLEYYGIRGIVADWFRSYLTDRSQFVSIAVQFHLELLLFLLYSNDFSNCAPQLDFHLFSEDSNL